MYNTAHKHTTQLEVPRCPECGGELKRRDVRLFTFCEVHVFQCVKCGKVTRFVKCPVCGKFLELHRLVEAYGICECGTILVLDVEELIETL